MKVYSALLCLAGLAAVNAAESLPWIETFAGLSNGATSDGGSTSWAVTIDHGLFSVKDEKLEIIGKAEGQIDTGDIDVSAAKFVEIKTSIYGDGGLDETGQWRDHIQVYAVLDSGRVLLVSHKFGGANKFREDLVGVVDVTDSNTLYLEIRARTTGGTEHYHIENISVESVGAETDGCTYYDLNMDSLDEGVYVSNQFQASHGVQLSCSCNSCSGGDCRVFDTSNPIGDPDLGVSRRLPLCA